MDFGYLPQVGEVDFSLPQDNSITASTLAAGRRGSLTCYVGLPILADSGYMGSLYPPGTKPRDFLRLYSQRFNAIEFNTTHYGIPKTDTVSQWRNSVPDTFRFCPKIPQSVSHVSDLRTAYIDRDRFLEVILGLGPCLGPMFIQFPPALDPSRLDELMGFLENWPKAFPLVVELRDEGWFHSTSQPFAELLHLMQNQGIGMVLTDVAGRRDVLHMALPTSVAFIRFNGYSLHASDYSRTNSWIARLRTWQHLGLKEAYFFHHQHTPALSLQMVSYMAERWNKGGVPEIKVPRLTRPDAQQSLF